MGGRLYTYRYTVTTRMTSALRLAAMRTILMFHNCEGQSPDSVHRPQTLKIKESRSGIEPRSFFQRPISGDTYVYRVKEKEMNERTLHGIIVMMVMTMAVMMMMVVVLMTMSMT